jgi:hypothetical protein
MSSTRLSRCFAAVALLVSTSATHAAEAKARLTVDVQVTGEEVWHGTGRDQATVKFSQHLSFATFVKSDGELADFNPKDPNYDQQQMQQAAKATQAASDKNKAALKTQEEMQKYVEEQARACGGDVTCLMKVSDEAAQWGAQLNGEPVARGESQSESAAGQFMQYVGYSKCGASMRVQIDDATQGSFGDAHGPVSFQVKTQADYTGSADDRELLCTQTNIVADVQKKTIFTDGILVFDIKGTVSRTQGGKTQTAIEDVQLKTEAFNWVSSQLREAPFSGKRQTTLKLRKPNGSNVIFAGEGQGTAKVELTWRFEEM